MPRLAWRWLFGIAVALDILLAAFIGANRGETVSHYANRHRDTWGGPVCAVLDTLDPNHCANVRY